MYCEAGEWQFWDLMLASWVFALGYQTPIKTCIQAIRFLCLAPVPTHRLNYWSQRPEPSGTKWQAILEMWRSRCAGSGAKFHLGSRRKCPGPEWCAQISSEEIRIQHGLVLPTSTNKQPTITYYSYQWDGVRNIGRPLRFFIVGSSWTVYSASVVEEC